MPLWFRRYATRVDGSTRATVAADEIRNRSPAKNEDREARRLGDEARDRGEWIEAIACYKRHLDTTPNDGAIWVQLGHAYKEHANLQAAEGAYLNAVALMPRDADLALQLGHLLKVSGRKKEAIYCYRKSVELEYTEDAARELKDLSMGDESIDGTELYSGYDRENENSATLLKSSSDDDNSQSFNEELIRAIYVVLLGREPEARGLEVYGAALKAGTSVQALLKEFLEFHDCIWVPKSESALPDKGATDSEALVSAVYTAILGRDPDPIGIANYGSALRGGMTAEALLTEFMAMKSTQPKGEDPLTALCISIREMALAKLVMNGYRLQLGVPGSPTGNTRLLSNRAADMLFTMQSVFD